MGRGQSPGSDLNKDCCINKISKVASSKHGGILLRRGSIPQIPQTSGNIQLTIFLVLGSRNKSVLYFPAILYPILLLFRLSSRPFNQESVRCPTVILLIAECLTTNIFIVICCPLIRPKSRTLDSPESLALNRATFGALDFDLSSTCTPTSTPVSSPHLLATMSDLENESRTSAVGRKRNATSKYKDFSSHSRQTSISSKESGEVSSSEGGGDGEDSDVEEISERQYNKRRKTDEGSEEGEVESGDTSSSMDTSDSDSEDSSFEMPETKDGPRRLQELSQADRDAQAKYFDITNPGSLVRCLCCGELGHMAVSCAARTCSHCNQRDVHQSSACPTYRKCGFCRERGHDARECKNRAYIGKPTPPTLPNPCL